MTRALENSENGYEVRDARVGVIAWVGIGILSIIALILIGLALLWGHFKQERPAHTMVRETRATNNAPRLQVSPANDLQALRVREQQVLASYDWVDRDSGLVRIPITQAMTVLVERAEAHVGQGPIQGNTLLENQVPAASPTTASLIKGQTEMRGGS